MEDSFELELFVKTNAKKTALEWDKDLGKHIAYVKSAPVKGKANKELAKLIKEHFKATEVRLVRGMTTTTKVFEVKGARDKQEVNRKIS